MNGARIQVAAHRPYEVVVGPGALARLGEALPVGVPSAVLTDTNVARLQGARLGACRALPCLAVPPGEESKTFSSLEAVLDFLLESGLERRSALVAFGGGVVGDLGGLAAALFQRGIACVQCPTTLLAQVDSSVGGKTAVNLRAGKNLAGAFHQPVSVLSDTETLATLPDEELRSGLGEVLKSALVGDGELLGLLEREAERVLARDAGLLAEIVERCVRVKAALVARDETEQGERKHLNLGHTFAHAIERAAGYGRIPHGVAVAVGLVLALRASERAGLLEDRELPTRLTALLARLGLPGDLATLRAGHAARLAPEELVDAMRHDKKGAVGRPSFVLLRGAERLERDCALDEAELVDLLG